jgi:hypothetical protein
MFNYNVENFELFSVNKTEFHPNAHRSSGGVIVYVRNTFVTSDMMVFNDDIVCIKISKDKLGLEDDLLICHLYVIPKKSTRAPIMDTQTYDRLLDKLVKLDLKYEENLNIVLCGDMNSRTSEDFAVDVHFF